jgi:hypothetical protein
MTEILGWSAWADKYKPITNKFSKQPNDIIFETYGEEVEFVRNYDPKYVWTNVQGDECDLIVAGYAYVNRLSYYITEIPWENEEDYVLISVENECECYSEEEDVLVKRNDNWGDPDCEKCEGSGYVTNYVG